jgi:hypothetical protein
VVSQVHMRHEATVRQSPAGGPSTAPAASVKLPSSLSQTRVSGAPEFHAKTPIHPREVVAAVWGNRPLAVHTGKPSGNMRSRLCRATSCPVSLPAGRGHASCRSPSTVPNPPFAWGAALSRPDHPRNPGVGPGAMRLLRGGAGRRPQLTTSGGASGRRGIPADSPSTSCQYPKQADELPPCGAESRPLFPPRLSSKSINKYILTYC